MIQCPCCSNKPYETCCKPLHEGKNAETPLALMRSRYSAYALNIPSYIQKTTHPKSPFFEKDLKKWTEEIQYFCKTTEFIRLEIIGFGEAQVHFIAYLKQNGKDLELNEESYFKKDNSHWRYYSAIFLS